MRNIDRFHEAFGHTEHRVMGRRLAKFSLRHRFWLEAFASPLVRGGAVELLDLEMAARVCAIPAAALDSRLPRLLARGPGRLGRLWWLARLWRRDAAAEYAGFQAYLLDFGCPPATWDGSGGQVEGAEDAPPESGDLPGLLSLVTGLMRGACWEPETVWRLSPGEAEWYLAGVFMHRGVDVGIKSAADEAMEEILAARAKAPVVTPAAEHGE